MPSALEHVFVLMLENRSFDHLFGFSGLSGIDAASGAPTIIDGLTGRESNSFDGKSYSVTKGADYAMPVDPGHEFPNVLDQLCGPGVRYVPPYPSIDGSGFVDSYDHSGGSANPAEVMRCFDTPRQLPVLFALAQEFAICDHWFSSLPGPTWPNRMFVHGASSGGLDHSPTTAEIVEWETLDGFAFPRGSLLQALAAKGKSYHVYSGDEFPMVAALKGVTLLDVHRVDDLVTDLKASSFPYSYVFIEPSYNVLHDYRNSSSQHPLADVRDGETLVKTVYEALRNSAIWEKSLLVILWDEHGGFYDHLPPPAATSPGDTPARSKYNQSGFTFEQYGVRTPAIVVSPRIPKGTIDHRVYDHASVPATVEALFELGPLTARDATARNLLSLLSLPAPRSPAEAVNLLPIPSAPKAVLSTAIASPMADLGKDSTVVSRAGDPINGGMLPAFVHTALRQDLQMAPDNKSEILARVASLQTRADAMNYLGEVQAKLRAWTPP
jgi:phospholipase C